MISCGSDLTRQNGGRRTAAAERPLGPCRKRESVRSRKLALITATVLQYSLAVNDDADPAAHGRVVASGVAESLPVVQRNQDRLLVVDRRVPVSDRGGTGREGAGELTPAD